MTPKDLAAILNGRQTGDETTIEIEDQAKAAGLVIVFGASDGLMEFRGAVDDEVCAGQGTEVTFDEKGLLADFDEIVFFRNNLKDRLRDYFQREGGGRIVKALWDQEAPYSWTFKTDISHATFEILDDGEPFCRGIVFQLMDAGDGAIDSPKLDHDET